MLVGFSNGSVTLGRFDVHFDVSTIWSYHAAPRKEHLGDIPRIFGYLNRHMKIRIICDTCFLEDQVKVDLELNWSEMYLNAVEEIPPDIPDPKSTPIRITTFIDADHSRYL